MATENIPKFFFYRTNEIVERNKVKGNRGILEVNGIYYYTIERDTSICFRRKITSGMIDKSIIKKEKLKCQYQLHRRSIFQRKFIRY